MMHSYSPPRIRLAVVEHCRDLLLGIGSEIFAVRSMFSISAGPLACGAFGPPPPPLLGSRIANGARFHRGIAAGLRAGRRVGSV
jgi:hypothetical protein